MEKTAQFREQHDNIVLVIQKISPLLERAQLVGQAQIVRLELSKLAGLVRVHLALEDRVLYPSLTRSTDSAVRSTAEQYIKEMGNISQVFNEFNDHWTSQAIYSNADGFIAQAKSVFTTLLDRINRENSILYPMVDRI